MKVISSEVVVLPLIGSLADGETLLRAVRRALEAAGLEPWSAIEAEVYTYGSRGLLIARPAPPMLERGTGGVRLKRKRGV